MFRQRILLSIVFSSLAAGAAWGDDSTRLDWSTWQRMPVFDRGRLMPLDSFARSVVRKICGSARPTLDPSGIPQTSKARPLFPEDKPRKFDAAELLFSWMVEPEKWERAPLLIAADGQLREVFLELPLRNKQKRRLEHVSPRQLLGADRFWERLQHLRRQQRWARDAGRELKPSGGDKKISELYEAYTLYRRVTFQPDAPGESRSRFFEKLATAAHSWRDLEGGLRRLPQPPDEPGSERSIEDVTEALEKLVRLIRQDSFTMDDADPLLAAFRRSADRLAEQIDAVCRRAFRDESIDHRQRAAINELAAKTAELARVADDTQMALYDNGRSLRLVPALSAAALKADRDLDDDNQPWLSLQTLLLGSGTLLKEYPQDELDRVRRAFDRLKTAYLDREASDRPQRFNAAMHQFAAAVRTLSEKIEPRRRQLRIPGEEQDIESMLAATAYPPEGYTDLELHYNRADPFWWSWVVCLLATICLGLSFVLARQPMFWMGILALILGQLVIVYVLTLRTIITGWVSVTNMFETVVFVALMAGTLGLWFTLLPLLRPGITKAWQVTGNRLLLLPRVPLMVLMFLILAVMPYGSGGARTIVNLRPTTDVGSSIPSANGVLTWAVGLCLLVWAVWHGSRLILAAVLSLVTVPMSWSGGRVARTLEDVIRGRPYAAVGAAVGLLALLLAYFAPIFDKDIRALMPILRDNFWLTVHVLSITASYGAAVLAWGLGNIALGHYLFGRYRDANVPARSPSLGRDDPAPPIATPRRPPEACATLAQFTYKPIQVTVLLLAIGTILGALWADVAWGRFWNWDSKEVWALICLLVYLAVLHSRYAGWSGDFGLALASVLGVTSIVMAWYGVNYLLRSGLHTYAGGSGGLFYVGTVVLCQWLYLAGAALRYYLESSGIATRGAANHRWLSRRNRSRACGEIAR